MFGGDSVVVFGCLVEVMRAGVYRLGVYSEGVGDVVETGVWCDVGGKVVIVGMSDGCIVAVGGWWGFAEWR